MICKKENKDDIMFQIKKNLSGSNFRNIEITESEDSITAVFEVQSRVVSLDGNFNSEEKTKWNKGKLVVPCELPMPKGIGFLHFHAIHNCEAIMACPKQ